MKCLYYNPEDFGLTPVGGIDWSDGCYVFDYTVVWRRQDGELVYGEDSGCSCRVPFENFLVKNLQPVTVAELQKHLEKRAREACFDESSEGDRWAMQIANLMAKVVS